MQEHGHSALRRGRFSEPGRVYHITTATHHRRPIFTELGPARTLTQTLYASPDQFRTLAHVIMPDHLHWLVQLQQSNLSDAVKTVKSVSSRRISTLAGIEPPIWQSGFYDHALRRDEELVQVARYIVANPIRAGLVSSPRAYSHWDAIWL